jgi:hypothetical protein
VASGIQTGSAVSDNEIRKCQKREMALAMLKIDALFTPDALASC